MASLNLSLMNRRYLVFITVVLVFVFLLLVSQYSSTIAIPFTSSRFEPELEVDQTWLREKIQSSEEIYQKTISKREGLINKFGPIDRIKM